MSIYSKRKAKTFRIQGCVQYWRIGKKGYRSILGIRINQKTIRYFNLDYEKIENLEGWGELSVTNLKNAINKSSKILLHRFIYSLGIRHIGQENAKLLGNFFKSIAKLIELFKPSKQKNLLKNISELDGIGSAQLNSLKEFFSNKLNNEIVSSLIEYLKIENSKVLNKDGKLSGKTIMFTGGFKKISRSEAKSLVEDSGGKVLGNISSKLNILVVGDSKPTKSKIEKANEIGIKIIPETDWYKLLNIWAGLFKLC